MRNWNLADSLDITADLRADEVAVIQGEQVVTWNEFKRRAESIGSWLRAQGLAPGAKVALYTYNDIAYLETCYACMQEGLVPVNVNYRYKADEIRYLLENSDAEAVLLHPDFVNTLCEALDEDMQLKCVMVMGSSSAVFGSNILAAAYEDVLSHIPVAGKRLRSGEDLIFIYTGGTTGMPKGVMWRHQDLYLSLGGGVAAEPPKSEEDLRDFIQSGSGYMRALILPPLMHGTAFIASMTVLLAGGTVVLAATPQKFSAMEALQTIERRRPTALSIVGDTFARPIVNELAANSYDISSVEFISSAGAIWSQAIKARLLEFNPDMRLVDGLASTEAHGLGSSVTTRETIGNPVPRFSFGARTVLVDEEHKVLPRRPHIKGKIAVGGQRPMGYYKDERKGVGTFVEINGHEYTISGDWAEINDDGETFTLLGRGSVCINTGGEKVYPEEVETVVKRFEGVADAVIVGVPDEQWGEAVVAVVSGSDGPVDAPGLIRFVSGALANYKCPKHIVLVEEVYRSPSGKADYKQTRELALKELAQG